MKTEVRIGFESTKFSMFPSAAIKYGGIRLALAIALLILLPAGLTGCNQKCVDSFNDLHLDCKLSQLASSPLFGERTVYPNYNWRYFSSLKSVSTDWQYSAVFKGDQCVSISAGSESGFTRGVALNLAQQLIPLRQHKVIEHDDDDLVKLDTSRAGEHFYYGQDYSAHFYYAKGSIDKVKMVKALRNTRNSQ